MATYEEVIVNPYTGEQVLIKSNDRYLFLNKKEKKIAQWERQEQKRLLAQEKEDAIKNAQEQTEETQNEIESYQSVLADTLKVNDAIDWKKLERHEDFRPYEQSPEPKIDQFMQDIPKSSLLDVIPLIKNKRLSAEANAKKQYEAAHQKYTNAEQLKKEKYEEEKTKFKKEQLAYNERLDALRKQYEAKDPEGIRQYVSLVLEQSSYPESLSLASVVNYDPNSRLLLVDMELPLEAAFPKIVEYKYVASKKEISKKEMSSRQFEQFYNSVIYQITLRTIHEIFESDYQDVVDLVVFNGWVDGIDRKTGKKVRNCLLTIQTTKEAFQEINLAQIDPKECFIHLKGVTAGSLVNLSPVRPIMRMDTADKRIVQADSVLEGIDENRNLATMEWKDFEVLVRDLFQKEFAHEGCRVEVTQASRDAGVDAIAFDEDPIRGGKYVIQAKRYNNLVPLTAVRDLYGTVLNEGAVKGILVTTSYFGKDSLEFVKDKPLKLINGEELLYMFSKHGYKLGIELQKKQKAASVKAY